MIRMYGTTEKYSRGMLRQATFLPAQPWRYGLIPGKAAARSTA